MAAIPPLSTLIDTTFVGAYLTQLQTLQGLSGTQGFHYIKHRGSEATGRAYYRCHRHKKPEKKHEDENRRRLYRSSERTNCGHTASLEKIGETDDWKIRLVHDRHNHKTDGTILESRQLIDTQELMLRDETGDSGHNDDGMTREQETDIIPRQESLNGASDGQVDQEEDPREQAGGTSQDLWSDFHVMEQILARPAGRWWIPGLSTNHLCSYKLTLQVHGVLETQMTSATPIAILTGAFYKEYLSYSVEAAINSVSAILTIW